jgi:hypothetical protein
MASPFPLPEKFFQPAPGKAERLFGWVMAAACALWSLQALRHSPPRFLPAPAAAAVGFALLALFRPGMLTVPNRLWLKLGQALHRVTSPIALGLIYFVAVVPTGLIARRFGHDPLRQRQPSGKTFWIDRVPRDPGHFRNQF